MLSNRPCSCCGTEKSADEFYPSYKTQCKSCLKAKAILNRASRLEYLKNWRANNRTAASDWYEKNNNHKNQYNASYYASNRERERARYNKWAKENKARINSLIAKRTAAKTSQTPSWADMDAMRSFYKQAEAMTKATGIRHEVDHIVPLQGKTVCGLHCQSNLQVLPKLENIRKKNHLLPEIETC